MRSGVWIAPLSGLAGLVGASNGAAACKLLEGRRADQHAGRKINLFETEASRDANTSGSADGLLGFDFLRTHRVFISDTHKKLFFTYQGGAVFAPSPSNLASKP
jgi:hypothetical protein